MRQIKTYRQFINEAYVDQEGKLRDLSITKNDLLQDEMLDHANYIREFLEDSGARKVKLRYEEDGSLFAFLFEYGRDSYVMELQLEPVDRVLVYVMTGRRGAELVYEDDADRFFDMVSNSGLDFLQY